VRRFAFVHSGPAQSAVQDNQYFIFLVICIGVREGLFQRGFCEAGQPFQNLAIGPLD